MPDHALELSFAPDSERVVLDQWRALLEAGLPSQAEHRSTTNAPHLTLVAASPIDPRLVEVARDRVLPLLPSGLTVRGLVLLGQGPRVTIAHLVEPVPALADAVAELRRAVPAVRHPVWTPHVTLARRVPRARLGEALDVLASSSPTTLQADRLRWWDPDQQLVQTL